MTLCCYEEGIRLIFVGTRLVRNVNCHGKKYPAVCAAENEAVPMGEHL